jgi:OFA family oxalate/formate antiporter-like MFS transporter
MILFLLQAVAFAVLPAVEHFGVLLVPAALIALCYGGGFGTMPAFATDVFGARNAGTIYGAMLTAWSAGAVVGPLLIEAVPYRLALLSIAGMLAIAVVLPVAFGLLVQRADSARTSLRATGLAVRRAQ